MNPEMTEEKTKEEKLLDKLETGQTFQADIGDTLVWKLNKDVTQDQLRSIKKHLQEELPEQQHIVINRLADVYQLETGDNFV